MLMTCRPTVRNPTVLSFASANVIAIWHVTVAQHVYDMQTSGTLLCLCVGRTMGVTCTAAMFL